MRLFNNSIYNVVRAVHQKFSKDVFYDGDILWNINFGYSIIWNSNATIMNTTIDESPAYTVYLNWTSGAEVINSNFNLSKLIISDEPSEAYICWGVTVSISDHFGNFVPNIFLRVRNQFGTILYEKYTNSSGYIGYLVILDRFQSYDGNITYNPTFFEADLGKHTLDTTINIQTGLYLALQLENMVPRVYNIMIHPQFATTSDDLELLTSYTFVDDEDDLENGTTFQWYRNDIHIPELDNSTIVPSNYTLKGETWYCFVTPCDGMDFGTPSSSMTVLIFNTVPIATNVTLSPDTPDGGEDLFVNYTYFDMDNDTELGTLFYWYAGVNSTFKLKATTDTPILPYTFTQEGEIWYVEVEPRDGE
jgi:hypothetical protein